MRWLLLSMLVALSAAAEPLTLKEALALAEARSLDLAVQDLAIEVAVADAGSDPEAGDPSFRFRLRDEDGLRGGRLSAPRLQMRGRVPLPRPWDLATGKQASDASADRERAQRDVLLSRLHLVVSTRFRRLPLLRQAVGVGEQLLAVRAERRDLVERRRQEGLSTAMDWLDAEEDRRDAADRLAGLRSRQREVEADLRRLLGLPDDDPLDLAIEDLALRATNDDLEALVADAAERSAEVREASARLARDEARLQRDSLRAVPWLDWIEGGAVVESGRARPEIGFALDVPVQQWSPARTREARARVQEAQLRLDEEREEATRQARAQARDVLAARDDWQVASAHRRDLKEASSRLLEAAGPLVRAEVEARLLRAELRELAAMDALTSQFGQFLAAVGEPAAP